MATYSTVNSASVFRALSVAVSLAFVAVAYPLAAWGYRRFDPIYGGGGEGLFLPFLVLPAVSGVLVWFAMRPLGKWRSRTLGVCVAALAFAVAVLGWRSEFEHLNTDTHPFDRQGVLANPWTVLTARQEVPRPRGSVGRVSGRLTAVVEKLGANTTITWTLKFRRLTSRARSAHIHLGHAGRPGPWRWLSVGKRAHVSTA